MIHFRRLSFSRNQSLEVSGKGTYVLVLRLSPSLALSVGRLGESYLAKGYYIYVGSAFGSGGLAARLRHHLKVSLNPHWHIDYLRKYATIVEIRVCTDDRRLEHLCAAFWRGRKGVSVPVMGFGSSDCGCDTHLFYSPTRNLLNRAMAMMDDAIALTVNSLSVK